MREQSLPSRIENPPLPEPWRGLFSDAIDCCRTDPGKLRFILSVQRQAWNFGVQTVTDKQIYWLERYADLPRKAEA